MFSIYMATCLLLSSFVTTIVKITLRTVLFRNLILFGYIKELTTIYPVLVFQQSIWPSNDAMCVCVF